MPPDQPPPLSPRYVGWARRGCRPWVRVVRSVGYIDAWRELILTWLPCGVERVVLPESIDPGGEFPCNP